MPVHIAIPEPTSARYVEDSAAYNQRSLPQYLAALHSAGATPIPIPLHESPERVARILSTVHGILLPGSPADVEPQKYGESRIPQCAPPDPAREAVDELLIQDAFNLHKPILGICQGMQALNVWCGGTLIQDLPTQAGTAVDHAPGRTVVEVHPIDIAPGTRLAGLVQNCHREAFHLNHALHTRHNAPDPSHPLTFHPDAELHPDPNQVWVNSSHHQAVGTVGDNFIVSARSPQDNVIEALELPLSNPHFVLAVQWHPERSYLESALSRAIFAAFVDAAETWTPRKIEESVLHA